jgi:hypothetical protein
MNLGFFDAHEWFICHEWKSGLIIVYILIVYSLNNEKDSNDI